MDQKDQKKEALAAQTITFLGPISFAPRDDIRISDYSPNNTYKNIMNVLQPYSLSPPPPPFFWRNPPQSFVPRDKRWKNGFGIVGLTRIWKKERKLVN